MARMTTFRVPINITFTGAGSPGANIWHIQTNDLNLTTELTQANLLIGYIRTFYNTLIGYFPAGQVFSLGTVTEVDSSREIVPTMSTVTGTGVANAPQLLALVVTWKTSIAARRGRGRTFIGPLTTACMQNDGTPVSTLLADANTAAAALIAASTAYGNGKIGVYGFQDAKTPGKQNPRNPADAKTFREFAGKNIRDQFGVLRSRRD